MWEEAWIQARDTPWAWSPSYLSWTIANLQVCCKAHLGQFVTYHYCSTGDWYKGKYKKDFSFSWRTLHITEGGWFLHNSSKLLWILHLTRGRPDGDYLLSRQFLLVVLRRGRPSKSKDLCNRNCTAQWAKQLSGTFHFNKVYFWLQWRNFVLPELTIFQALLPGKQGKYH